MRISDWSSDVCSSDLRLLQDLVELRVAVPAPVRGAHALFLVVRREQRLQRRRGFARAGTPADENEAELQGRGALEVDALRHGVDLGRDAVAEIGRAHV